MKKTIMILVNMLILHFGFAQLHSVKIRKKGITNLELINENLVSNYSFEDFQYDIPVNFYFHYSEFNNSIIDWKTTNMEKPLVFNLNTWIPDFFYHSTLDSVIPHSGKTMLGLHIDKSEPGNLQGTLKEPLVIGELYYVAFFVSRNHNGKLASNNIGLKFIDTPIFYETDEKAPIIKNPDLNESEIICTQKGEWKLISGVVKAKSRAKYLLIGNFLGKKKTIQKVYSIPRAKGNCATSHAKYFIDDVIVLKYNENVDYSTIASAFKHNSEITKGCNHESNLVHNSKFNDYENYMDKNQNFIYDPKYWLYKQTGRNHPLYFSSDRFLNKNLRHEKFHPDGEKILHGEIFNYIGVPIMPKPEKIITKLKCPLQKDSLYILKFDVKINYLTNCFSDIQIGFSDESPLKKDCFVRKYLVEIPDSLTFEKLRENWYTISKKFVALGNEQYLSIATGTAPEYKMLIGEDTSKFDKRTNSYHGLYLNYSIDNVILKRTVENQPETTKYTFESAKIGETIIFENIHFEFNKSELQAKSYNALSQLLNYLKDKTNVKILITGHTDNVGGQSYNKKLSSSRAKVIVNYLIDNGIDEERLQHKGMGELQPISTEKNEVNRRVEITIIDR